MADQDFVPGQPQQPETTAAASPDMPAWPISDSATQKMPRFDPQTGKPLQADAVPASWAQTMQQPEAPSAQPASPYAQPEPVAAAVPQKNGKATGALVCGILAILTAPTVVLGVLLGIVAIVLAILAKRAGRDGKATGGLACGIIGLALAVITGIAGLVAGAALVDLYQNDPEFQSAVEKLEEAEDFEDLFEEADPIGQIGTEGIVTEDGAAGQAIAADDAVANDDVCIIQITGQEVDDAGDLCVYFTATNRAENTIEIYSDITSWQVNGTPVDCYCYTEAEPGQTVSDFFFVEGDGLPITDMSQVDSMTGTLVVDVADAGITRSYPVEL